MGRLWALLGWPGVTRVALATTNPELLYGGDVDVDIVLRELIRVGITAEATVWHDPQVDWSRFDLVIMRSPWDYPERHSEFLDWLDETSAVTRVLNCPETIKWNLDKSYLAELSAEGVPTVETYFCHTREEVLEAERSVDSAEIVVKPNISAGSRHTGRFRKGDVAAVRLADHILSLGGKSVLIQPCVESVSVEGERALLYFDGVYSHAVRKGPILALGGSLVGGTYTEQISPYKPDADDIAVADAAMAATTRLIRHHGCACERSTPLYARLTSLGIEGTPSSSRPSSSSRRYFSGRPRAPSVPSAPRSWLECGLSPDGRPGAR